MQDLPIRERFRLMPFRFLVLYLTFYILPFPFHFIPGAQIILAPISSVTTKIVDRIGPLIFGKLYNAVHVQTGSGDTSFQYARVFLFFILALVASSIWSIFDRKHSSYKKMPVVLNIFVTYYLAANLLSYGFMKVFPLQFPSPSFGQLTKTYGESSPMGLLWTFMGYSKLYSAFTGASEALAGVGLLFRRTKLPAAILAAFVFLHVLILNLAYDVPVKLFSFHLFVMTLVLIIPQAKKVIDAFSNDNTPKLWSEEHARKMRWFMIGLKIVLIYFIFAQPLYQAFKRYNELHKSTAQQPNETRESYEVLSIKNSEPEKTRAPAPKWKLITLRGNMMETIYDDGFSLKWHYVLLNRSQILRFASTDLSNFGEFKLSNQKENLLFIGKLNQDSITIQTRKTSSAYNPLLLSRKFHWINEEPYNR